MGEGQGVTAEVTFGTAYPPCGGQQRAPSPFSVPSKEMFGDEAWDMRTAWGSLQQKTSAEDFSYIAEKVPSGFGWIFLGDSRQGDASRGCHNPKVQFNDAYLYQGAAALY